MGDGFKHEEIRVKKAEKPAEWFTVMCTVVILIWSRGDGQVLLVQIKASRPVRFGIAERDEEMISSVPCPAAHRRDEELVETCPTSPGPKSWSYLYSNLRSLKPRRVNIARS